MAGKLSDRDHQLMDGFLAEMADAVVSGALSKASFVEAMAYVMTALDIGHREEALVCFAAGAKHFEAAWPSIRVPDVQGLSGETNASQISVASVIMLRGGKTTSPRLKSLVGR